MRARLLALFFLVAASSAAHAERTVAIGDIHGDYDALVSILSEAQLLGDGNSWVGGDATLVQLGDFLDRGDHPRRVMDLLIDLQEQASAAGGRVIVLMGNHEALNLLGEVGDASPTSLAAWADSSTELLRGEEYKKALKAGRRRAQITPQPRPSSGGVAREQWLTTHPQGLLPYLADLLPDGRYGRWLRSLPIVAKVGDTLFLHGGLAPAFAALSPEEMNARAHEEMQRADRCRELLGKVGYLTLTSNGGDLVLAGRGLLAKLRKKAESSGGVSTEDGETLATLARCEDYESWFLLREDGPLWLRDYAHPQQGASYGWSEEEGVSQIEEVLAAQGIRHVVVAHTPHASRRIQARFGGAVFLIDTGMLARVYGGRPSALEIRNGVFTAVYPGESEVLLRTESATTTEKEPPWSWKGRDGKPLPFSSEDELLEFLRNAKIVSQRASDHGINRPLRVVLERDGTTVRGVFRTVDKTWRNQRGPDGEWHANFRDSYVFECAAYELSRVLGLDRVPPAVQRKYRGASGSLQVWVENARMEADIFRASETPPDVRSWVSARLSRKVFDALINNRDRNSGNTLVDADWEVWFIDHGRTFLPEPNPEMIAELKQIDRGLLGALRATDHAQVSELLAPYLAPWEIKSLLERWDAILARFDEAIETLGEAYVYYP